MDVDDICTFLAELIKTDTSLINHIHCYGINHLASNKLVENLVTAIEEDSTKANQKNCGTSTFNCFEHDPKELMAEIEGDINDMEENPRLFHAFLISRAEEFQNFNKESLRMFVNRFKQTRAVKLITISEKPWSKIESDLLKMSLSSPVQFHIPTSNEEHIVEEIACSLDLSEEFVKLITDAVGHYYAGFEIFQHIVKVVAVWCRAQGLSIDGTMSHATINKISSKCKEIKLDSAFPAGLPNQDDNADYMDYPVLTKFVIIAAYCASYNPPISDRRFFFKQRDILRRKKNITKAMKEREKFHETGPKPFDHQRLLFIFLFFWNTYADDRTKKEVFSIDLNSQVVNLASNGILKMLHGDACLDMPKYRCLCSLSLVEGIAQSLDEKLNIRDFLLDFAID